MIHKLGFVIRIATGSLAFFLFKRYQSRDKNVAGRNDEVVSYEDSIFQIITIMAQRSPDPVTQVGAAVVNPEGRIISLGYNQMPMNCSSIPWLKPEKTLYVCCAEQDALRNLNVKDCSIFVSMFPCNDCARLITHSGIKEVVYYSNKKANKKQTLASRLMLEMARVQIRQYTPPVTTFTYDMAAINKENGGL